MASNRRRQGKKTPSAPATARTRSRHPHPGQPVMPKDADSVVIRCPNCSEITIAGGPELESVAMRWQHIVRMRQRWQGENAAEVAHREHAQRDLARLGVDQGQLHQIASAGYAEVGTRYESESRGWAGRLLPWEYVLSAATRAMRERSLLVTRHLAPSTGLVPPTNSGKILFVESAPGLIEEIYGFDSERGIIRSNSDLGFLELRTPRRDELRERILAEKPEAIHITGVDSHEGAQLLSEGPDPKRRDGFYLRGADDQPHMVEALDLARTLNPDPNSAPTIVTFNCFFAAARICALTVAEGARYAIGIQDIFEHAPAENFFAIFYRAFSLERENVLQAFRHTMRQMRQENVSLTGSGIVLWSQESLLKYYARDADLVRRLREAAQEKPAQPLNEVVADGTGAGAISDVLSVEVKVEPEINYSLLHNNRNLFTSFKIGRLERVTIKNVEVLVELFVGSDRFPYQACYSVDDTVLEISNEVRVPLTWSYVRTLQESVRTTLFVQVSVGSQIAYRKTHTVTLYPVNEWKDDQRDAIWLPSFVLPRDPSVVGVINAARNNLMALRDNFSAGFDGYQRGDPSIVDNQVQAIWSALAFGRSIAYIEPPPAYALASQRLRTPMEVLETQQGTCIDLSLTLASCFEYIGLHPVIFLIHGHAFPGYWRDPQAHTEFLAMTSTESAESGMESDVEEMLEFEHGDSMARGAHVGLEKSFKIGASGYRDILQAIDAQALQPLESTCLTTNESLQVAWGQGLENLYYESEFDCMLDITRARRENVTPLPLGGH